MRRLPPVRRVLRSAYATSAWATIAFSLVTAVSGVLAARALGPYERGLLATAVVWSSLAGSISAYGTPLAASYFAARETADPPRSAATVLAIAAVIGAGVAAVGSVVSLLLVPGKASVPMAIAFAGMLPGIVAGAGLGTIMGLGEYLRWGLLRLSAPLLVLAGVIALVLVAGWQTAVAVTTIAAAAGVVQLVVLLRAVATRGLLHRPSAALVRPILSYMWRNIASGAGWLVSTKLDLLVLSIVYAPEEVGVYAVAASFGVIIVPIASSTGNVLLARVAKGGDAALRRTLRPALAGCLAIACAFALLVVVSAPHVVPLLFGAGFEDSVAPLQILMPGSVALSVSAVLANALRGLGRPLEPARAELAGAIATLLLLPLLLPLLGIVGAAIASTLSYVIVTVAMAWRLRRARS